MELITKKTFTYPSLFDRMTYQLNKGVQHEISRHYASISGIRSQPTS